MCRNASFEKRPSSILIFVSGVFQSFCRFSKQERKTVLGAEIKRIVGSGTRSEEEGRAWLSNWSTSPVNKSLTID